MISHDGGSLVRSITAGGAFAEGAFAASLELEYMEMQSSASNSIADPNRSYKSYTERFGSPAGRGKPQSKSEKAGPSGRGRRRRGRGRIFW
jgi:hypothetical protein